jgi:8-oxo-dGTP pyrophosphatase MutT (NUDIX family)
MFTNQKKKNPKNRKTRGKAKPRAIREYTAGGMVFRRNGRGVDILMIQDVKGRWTIPKGHVEEGETLEETAVREIGEETGLKKLAIRDKLDKIFFFYRREGRLIFMTTHIYLMEALGDTDELIPGDSEGITAVKWFPQEEALKLIEYKDTEKLFRLGLSKLKVRTI